MSPFPPAAEFAALAPEILLAVCGCVLLVAGAIGRGLSHRMAAGATLASFAAAAIALVIVRPEYATGRLILNGGFAIDPFALFWNGLVIVGGALAALVSLRFVEEGGQRPGEYYALLLLAATGMAGMASGYSLLAIWISLELMALASYVLTGYFRDQTRSHEAALKYFVLGALSSGVMLYGISLVYGATGTLQLDQLAAATSTASGDRLLAFGWLLMLAGLLFKVAAVPFHVWTPDVYTGAPTPVTAFLAAGSKAISFAVIVRILFQGLPGLAADWKSVLAVVAAATMIWGNVAALTQRNVKRMLAYSSIAHAGYILMGIVATNAIGSWAVLFYLASYVFVTFGVFAVVILLERGEYAGETTEDFAGLASRAPFLSATLVVFLLALTGIPPTGGFVGKLYLFAAAIQGGWGWLAVVGVLTSAMSLYYYFRLVVAMYQQDATAATPRPLRASSLATAIVVCVIVTLVLGLYPGPLIDLARSAALPVP